MNSSGTIIWNDNAVGKVTNIRSDMWYIDADWKKFGSEVSHEFENLASALKKENTMRDLSKGILAQLNFDDDLNSQYVLIISQENESVFMRMITGQTAAQLDINILAPWQKVDNPTFYENQLKKELSFIHPLFWKKSQVIGIKIDQDEVLLELLSGSQKYAVVRLGCQKRFSIKYPTTQFYLHWDDVYKNKLLPDHQKFTSDEMVA